MEIAAVLRRHEAELLELPNVSGVGIGERRGRRVIVVYVSRKLPEAELRPRERVPENLEGYPCVVEEIGVPSAEAK